MHVTKEQIRQARKSNLADYLLREHPADVRFVGSSLCLKKNTSLYVKKSVSGYHDFTTGEHGNSIDFLTRHLNYSFMDAVDVLCRFSGAKANLPSLPRPFSLPTRAAQPFQKVVDYLAGRGIPEKTVLLLIREGLLYQDSPHRNAVFVTPDEDYCEIRGTGNKPFHGCRKKRPDKFWYFLTDPKPETAYICEAAIDAVSLMLIHRQQRKTDSAVYVSIGGVANQQTIDRLKKRIPTVLAVDNDSAGKECRRRNPEIPALIPVGKDWNDDLNSSNSL